MGRASRVGLIATTGLIAAAGGLAVCVPRVVLGRAGALDYAGTLLAPLGVVLIAGALRLALHGSSRRAKLLAIPVCAVVLQWLVVPVMTAAIATNAPRPHIPAAASLGLPGARDVTFRARDGVRLSGWFVPGRRDAAVIVLHGSHNSRVDATRHVRMLAAAGYTVLAFDARGHGASAGRPNALGWRGVDDVAGAVAFLRRGAATAPRSIALLGLSMGAEEALRAAARGIAVDAVVADGAGASTLGDMRLTSGSPLPVSVGWLSMRATELLSGSAEPAPLARVVRAIRVPVLLIASGARDELALGRVYQRHIGSRAALWYVAGAGHTGELARHPAAYAARVTRFLAVALRERSAP